VLRQSTLSYFHAGTLRINVRFHTFALFPLRVKSILESCGLRGFAHLSPPERVKRYRGLAAEAHRMSVQCTGQTRQSYLDLEKQWEKLARDIEEGSAERH
jgi:hypothetical protein